GVDGAAERKAGRGGAGEEAGRGGGEVVLESKLALERLHDRLDPLADEADRRARSLGLGCRARAQDDRAERGDGLFELFAGEALVADHELALKRLALEQAKRRLALGRIRGHEVEVADGAVGPAAQHEAHAPEVARMGGAPAERAPGRELAARDGGGALATRQRRRVEQTEAVVEARQLA